MVFFGKAAGLISCVVASLALALQPYSAAAASDEIGRLIAVGDIMRCDEATKARAVATAALVSREIKSAERAKVPIKVIVLGDLAYNDGNQTEFKCFRDNWLRAASLAKPNEDMLPVMGNHDMITEQGKWYLDTFKDNVHAGNNKNSYYTLSFPEGMDGAWRLFGMNSNIEAHAGSKQFKWLDEELAKEREAKESSCLAAFWHAPVFSSGHHGHNESKDYDIAEPIRQHEMGDIETLLNLTGASVILNGHDHNYEEILPHDMLGRPASTGIRSFIVGTGGKELYHAYAKKWPDITKDYDSKSYGILTLSLKKAEYSWAFWPISAADPAKPKYSGSGTCNTRR